MWQKQNIYKNKHGIFIMIAQKDAKLKHFNIFTGKLEFQKKLPNNILRESLFCIFGRKFRKFQNHLV